MTGRHIFRKTDTAKKAGLLVLAFAAAVVLAVVAVALGSGVLTVVGLAVAVALAGVVAAYLIVTERRRHEAAEQELTSEARFLESLVETMGSIAGNVDVLERTRQEAERLFEARALLLAPGERPRRAPAENAIVIPLSAHDEEIGALRLTRGRPFARDDVVRAAVRALTDQIELVHHVHVDLDVDVADRLAEKTQAALYQIVREAINQAVRRGPPEALSVTIEQSDDGGVVTAVSDDAPGERRRRRLHELEEPARTLNGELTVDQRPGGGTTVRVILPPYAASR